jgi:hypothetical protein
VGPANAALDIVAFLITPPSSTMGIKLLPPSPVAVVAFGRVNIPFTFKLPCVLIPPDVFT